MTNHDELLALREQLAKSIARETQIEKELSAANERAEAECRNKKEFERDWHEACDAQLKAEADARELWRALRDSADVPWQFAYVEKHRAKYGRKT